MAKKSRKSRIKQRATAAPAQQVAAIQVKPGASKNNQVSQAQVSAVAGVNQYSYVAGDLVRIGIIAGALILVLIVLTFVLK
jgi:hypothetical protein